jgi:selenocysteine lyase/cysteine desulfurase
MKMVGAGAVVAPAAGLLARPAGAARGFGWLKNGDRGSPGFWKRVRAEFVLTNRYTYMNVGTTGSTPRSVLQAYDRDNYAVAEDPRNRLGNENLPSSFSVPLVREQLAQSYGCGPDEVVASANTTNAMTLTLNGLKLQAGDVVITTNQEHPGLLAPLQILMDRRGVQVVQVKLPVGEPQSVEQYVQLFRNAIATYGSSVKLLAFSAPTFTTGTMLPIRELVDLSIEAYLGRGWIIHTLVDGAHASGMFNLNFNELDPDFMCCSGHKWQCGPGATGVWYLRNQVRSSNPIPLPPIYPTDTSSYRNAEISGNSATVPPSPDGARGYNVAQFMQDRGNPNFPALAALANVSAFWDAIGRDAIENYVVDDLGLYTKNRIADYWGAEALFSPRDEGLRSALTSFTPFPDAPDDKQDSDLFVTRLFEDYGYYVRNTTTPVVQEDGSVRNEYPIRISTHVFHDRRDVDGLIDAMIDLTQRFPAIRDSGALPSIFSREFDG